MRAQIKPMPTTLVRISRVTNFLVIVLSAVLLAIIFVVTIIAAFNKYITGASLTWAIGVNQAILPWIAALSTTVALKYGEHIAMSFLAGFVPARVNAFLRFINYFLVGVFGLFLGYYGYEFMKSSDQMIMISSAIQISGMWPAASLPVTGVIYCIHLLAGPQLLALRSVMDELDSELAK